MKKIIVISGKMQTGKDEVGKIIIRELKSRGYTVAHDYYAKDVKEYCMEDFKTLAGTITELRNIVGVIKTKICCDAHLITYLNELEKELTLTDDSYFDDKTKISRILLQTYGTNIIRNRIDSDYWAKQVRDRAYNSDCDYVVITDARFPNEIGIFEGYEDLITIRVERDTGIENHHASEVSLDTFKEWTYIVDNNDTLSVLEASVSSMMYDFMYKDNSIPFSDFCELGKDSK